MPPIMNGHGRRRSIWCFRVAKCLLTSFLSYDFKSELERKKIRDWLKSISAYANTEGGSLFFGVQNGGTVVGLDNPQGVADFISEKVNAHLDPLPEWSLIPHEIEGKAVIEAAVFPV